MIILILGLIIFLGVHSVRIVADDWRDRQIKRRGEWAWKGAYALMSIIGFALIVWGYGLARAEPIPIWSPPVWTRHLAALLTLPAFILLVAAYVPGNAIKAVLGHPMVVGVKVWAFAHLIANGTLADLVLFGAFLAWAVMSFRAARARDRAAGTSRPGGSMVLAVVAAVVGLGVWALFAFYLHLRWIGVPTIA